MFLLNYFAIQIINNFKEIKKIKFKDFLTTFCSKDRINCCGKTPTASASLGGKMVAGQSTTHQKQRWKKQQPNWCCWDAVGQTWLKQGMASSPLAVCSAVLSNPAVSGGRKRRTDKQCVPMMQSNFRVEEEENQVGIAGVVGSFVLFLVFTEEGWEILGK